MEDNKETKKATEEMKCSICGRVRQDRTEEHWATRSGRNVETTYQCPLHVPEHAQSTAHKKFLKEYPDGIKPKVEQIPIPSKEEFEEMKKQFMESEKVETEQYEYCMYKVPPFNEDYVLAEPEMNRLGKEGRWRLVSVDKGIAYFMRGVKK